MRLFAMIALSVSVSAMAIAPPVAPDLLDKVSRGQWQFKEIGGQESRSICVTDPTRLLWLNQNQSSCAVTTVIDSKPGSFAVRYACPGAGQGRTDVTVRGPGSLRVHTQGVSGGQPFDFDFDGRHVGDCAPPLTAQ